MLPVLLFVSAATATNILFVGNGDANGSGYGGVPGIFKKLVGASYNVTIEAIFEPAERTLQYHLSNRAAVLSDPKWDVVVLQDADTTPLPPNRDGDPALFSIAVTNITNLVRASAGQDTKIWLFETWACPDQVYPADGEYHDVANGLAAMQLDLRTAYYALAAQQSTGVVTVGDAFLNAVNAGVADANPYDGVPAGTINLWADDNNHASKYGSYLAAVSFFSKIAGGDPNSIPTGKGSAASDLGISEADAKKLHAFAA